MTSLKKVESVPVTGQLSFKLANGVMYSGDIERKYTLINYVFPRFEVEKIFYSDVEVSYDEACKDFILYMLQRREFEKLYKWIKFVAKYMDYEKLDYLKEPEEDNDYRMIVGILISSFKGLGDDDWDHEFDLDQVIDELQIFNITEEDMALILGCPTTPVWPKGILFPIFDSNPEWIQSYLNISVPMIYMTERGEDISGVLDHLVERYIDHIDPNKTLYNIETLPVFMKFFKFVDGKGNELQENQIFFRPTGEMFGSKK